MSAVDAEILICGAGIAGVSAAYHLVVKQGLKNVLLIDERRPLTLTSDKGTQAYRNWWPGPDNTMVQFINRSIDLLEELAHANNNCFELNRRGYVYLTANADEAAQMRLSANEICRLGAGELRIHKDLKDYIPTSIDGFEYIADGADLITDADAIHTLFPFITPEIDTMLHVRRAGWMNAPAMGQLLFNKFLEHGGQFIQDRIEAIKVVNNRIDHVRLSARGKIYPGNLVIAAGPHLRAISDMLDLNLPVIDELHGKVTFPDYEKLLPYDLPLMILNDAIHLDWQDDKQKDFANNIESNNIEIKRLLSQFPAGVHLRPKGDAQNHDLMIIWTYDKKVQEYYSAPQFDPYFGEILMRGIAKLFPALTRYFNQSSRAYVDGGYYCKTPENRPLIGPLPITGTYIIGALSGYGVMSSQAAGELLAAHITNSKLPTYAPMFLLDRYQDPTYQALMAQLDSAKGQL